MIDQLQEPLQLALIILEPRVLQELLTVLHIITQELATETDNPWHRQVEDMIEEGLSIDDILNQHIYSLFVVVGRLNLNSLVDDELHQALLGGVGGLF